MPLVIIFGLVTWRVITAGTSRDNAATAGESSSTTQPQTTASKGSSSTTLLWQQRENGWQAVGTVPSCPNPLNLPTPATLRLATSILYPGQTRGGNYKPHGGFRFDNSKNTDVTVTAPLDGFVVRGAQYLVGGEKQYTFDVMNNCGLMYRLGHLLVLSSKYQAIADKFPEAQEGDSRTEHVNPPIAVTKGETIATSVGVTVGGVNTFFDFGVYNFNTKNTASADAAWAELHNNDAELAPHAVCWFDLLSTADENTVRALPAGDPESGKNSDYCQ